MCEGQWQSLEQETQVERRLEAARELWVIGFARATTNQTVFDDFRIKFTVLCEMTSVLNWEGGSAGESNYHPSMRTWVYTPAAMSIANTCNRVLESQRQEDPLGSPLGQLSLLGEF